MKTAIAIKPDASPHEIYESGCKALAAVKSVDEAKDVRDRFAAIATYVRKRKNTEMEQCIAALKLRAEKVIGEMLRDLAERGERAIGARGRPPEISVTDEDAYTNLKRLGISRNESSKFQQLAAIPSDQFEAALAKAKTDGVVPTTAAMLRFAAVLKDAEGVREMEARIAREKPWRSLLHTMENLADASDHLLNEGDRSNRYDGWREQFAGALLRLNAALVRLLEKENEHHRN